MRRPFWWPLKAVLQPPHLLPLQWPFCFPKALFQLLLATPPSAFTSFQLSQSLAAQNLDVIGGDIIMSPPVTSTCMQLGVSRQGCAALPAARPLWFEQQFNFSSRTPVGSLESVATIA